MSRYGDNSKIGETQQQVDEVVGIMRNNMEKVLERDAALGDLEDKSDALADGSKRFQTSSRKLKNAMWWQDKKWCMIITFVVTIIIIIIIAVETGKDKK
eukprot:CAMPEP_0206314362 /NCGR_PEP_ID=MMETSP0106_2-20121207/14981_1 /ASSEMBLY_ACC=CAM_ASM_000206 /TAXON_ID=81532 /ORGANISM="Acanthoeca-like sp., Strain 10tr" /LENGTH=98 /DNA_ID=CAMNT_0053745721 /DNA_START=47 /DNA_END=343 /DNA_ORIENTATION=+